MPRTLPTYLRYPPASPPKTAAHHQSSLQAGLRTRTPNPQTDSVGASGPLESPRTLEPGACLHGLPRYSTTDRVLHLSDDLPDLRTPSVFAPEQRIPRHLDYEKLPLKSASQQLAGALSRCLLSLCSVVPAEYGTFSSQPPRVPVPGVVTSCVLTPTPGPRSSVKEQDLGDPGAPW